MIIPLTIHKQRNTIDYIHSQNDYTIDYILMTMYN